MPQAGLEYRGMSSKFSIPSHTLPVYQWKYIGKFVCMYLEDIIIINVSRDLYSPRFRLEIWKLTWIPRAPHKLKTWRRWYPWPDPSRAISIYRTYITTKIPIRVYWDWLWSCGHLSDELIPTTTANANVSEDWSVTKQSVALGVKTVSRYHR
jgi:hypothetical protein